MEDREKICLENWKNLAKSTPVPSRIVWRYWLLIDFIKIAAFCFELTILNFGRLTISKRKSVSERSRRCESAVENWREKTSTHSFVKECLTKTKIWEAPKIRVKKIKVSDWFQRWASSAIREVRSGEISNTSSRKRLNLRWSSTTCRQQSKSPERLLKRDSDDWMIPALLKPDRFSGELKTGFFLKFLCRLDSPFVLGKLPYQNDRSGFDFSGRFHLPC